MMILGKGKVMLDKVVSVVVVVVCMDTLFGNHFGLTWRLEIFPITLVEKVSESQRFFRNRMKAHKQDSWENKYIWQDFPRVVIWSKRKLSFECIFLRSVFKTLLYEIKDGVHWNLRNQPAGCNAGINQYMQIPLPVLGFKKHCCVVVSIMFNHLKGTSRFIPGNNYAIAWCLDWKQCKKYNFSPPILEGL